MKNVILALCVLTAGGCDAVRNVAPTVLDIASAMCEMFAVDHPEEFEQYARASLPPGAGELSELSVKELCMVPEIVRPFVGAQQVAQERVSVGLAR